MKIKDIIAACRYTIQCGWCGRPRWAVFNEHQRLKPVGRHAKCDREVKTRLAST